MKRSGEEDTETEKEEEEEKKETKKWEEKEKNIDALLHGPNTVSSICVPAAFLWA